VDPNRLRAQILAVYDHTAREGARPPSGLGLAVGADLARQLGYPEGDLIGIPEAVCGAFVGAGCLAPEVTGPGAVADLGCGAGLDAWVLARRGHRVVALDASEGMMCRLAGALRGEPGLPVRPVRAVLPHLPLRSGGFRWALLNGAANLVPQRDELLHEVSRVLAPGGTVLVADLVAVGEIPREVREQPEAWAWCVAGADPPHRWTEGLRKAGFSKIRVEILEEFPPLARAVIRAQRNAWGEPEEPGV